MGWALKYCEKCKNLYSGASDRCSTCGNQLKISRYDADAFETLNEEEKKRVTKELFGDVEVKNTQVSETIESNNTTVSSGVGNAIKAISIVIIVLSVLGAIVMMGNTSVIIGIVSLIVSLLVGLLAYGIGEICTLLTRIESKL